MSDVITLKGVENFIPKNIFEYEDFDHQKLLIAYREGCHNLHVFNYGQVDSTRNVDVKKLLLGESFELSLCNNGRLLCTVSDYSSFIIPQWIAAQFQYRVPTTVLVRRNDFTEGDIFRIKQEGACKSAVDLLKAQQDSILFDVSSVPVSLHGRVVIIQDDTTQSIDQIFCQYDPFFRSDFEGQRYAYFGHEGYVTRWKLVN